MSKSNNGEIQVKIVGDSEHDVVFCDVIQESRVGDTYYIHGIQFDPLSKVSAVTKKSNEIKAVKRVSLVMDKEAFANFVNNHMAFINQLKKEGIIDDKDS